MIIAEVFFFLLPFTEKLLSKARKQLIKISTAFEDEVEKTKCNVWVSFECYQLLINYFNTSIASVEVEQSPLLSRSLLFHPLRQVGNKWLQGFLISLISGVVIKWFLLHTVFENNSNMFHKNFYTIVETYMLTCQTFKGML